MSYKEHFSRSLRAAAGRLHFAAHSHHLWPDVTFEAQVACWEDAARLADRKWEHVFGVVVPETQRRIAAVLGLSDPASLAFAPNTHEFLRRVLSCLPAHRPPRVLTSDGEFHSFTRQMARLAEEGLVDMTVVPVEPFADFVTRFCEAALSAQGEPAYDLVYLSQVFFNSGFAPAGLDDLIRGIPDERTFIVIDGYHGFLARPTDLSAVEDRIFYLSGGYKYAMAGEGVCFLHAPDGYGLRPRDTGWYAAFGALEKTGDRSVAYAEDARRFLGATFDPVGLYRQRAVLDLLAALGVGAREIQAHARALQLQFIEGLERQRPRLIPRERLLLDPGREPCGQFLTFDLGLDAAATAQARMMAADIVTDYRGSRLRFGFGLYQDEADVAQLLERLAAL